MGAGTPWWVSLLLVLAGGVLTGAFTLGVSIYTASFLKYGTPRAAGGGGGVWAVVPRPRA
jgi:hypothetical protein